MEQTLGPLPPTPAAGFDLRARLRAAGIHLGLSLVVAALAAVLVFVVWYPMPFREISGGRELFFIVVAVDVTVGPLITFAVFNRRKPWRELKRDLAVVALLQLAALGYGLHTVFVARPVATVLEVDRLRVVTANDLAEQDVSKALPEWQRMPWAGVRIAAARRATSEESFDAITQAIAGFDVGQRPQFWRPSAEAPAAVDQAAKPFAALLARHPGRAAELQAAAAATGLAAGRLKFLPLMARATDWSALVEAGTGRIVGYVHADGF
jgi:hypothetical protein